MSVQKAVYNDVWPSSHRTCQWCLEPGIRRLHKAMAVALLAWLLALILAHALGLWNVQIPVSLGMGHWWSWCVPIMHLCSPHHVLRPHSSVTEGLSMVGPHTAHTSAECQLGYLTVPSLLEAVCTTWSTLLARTCFCHPF